MLDACRFIPPGQVRLSLLAAVMAVLCPVVASGQMLVLTSEPFHGTVELATSLRVTWEFSEPVDTTYAPADGSTGFLSYSVHPDPGPPGAVVVSADGRRVAVDLELQPETHYWFVVRDARSAAGDTLIRPYGHALATAAYLPWGIVSGSLVGEGRDDALVTMLEVGDLFADGDPGVGGWTTGRGDGIFDLDHVPDGSYYVRAHLDTNRNRRPDPGEPFSFLDADLDGVADVLVIQNGVPVYDLLLNLKPLEQTTAQGRSAAAGTFAASWNGDSKLLGLFAENVSAEGRALSWFFRFRSESAARRLHLGTLGTWIVHADVPHPISSTAPVADLWIDSDVAVGAADATGGSELRARYPDVRVDAVLANETASAWHITYRWATSSRTWVVAAVGGGVEPGSQLLASEALSVVEPSASSWKTDAWPVSISAGAIDGAELSGRSVTWSVIFYSASSASARRFTVTGTEVTDNDPVSTSNLPSRLLLPDAWIDSDEAVRMAEASLAGWTAGRIYQLNEAFLTRGLVASNPSLTAWRLVLVDVDSGQRAITLIDASSGAVITAVEPPVPGLPDALGQPWPNPATGVVQIPVPAGSAVRGRILDLIGRTVARFDRAAALTGPIAIDVSDWAPGVYLVTLEGSGAARPIVVGR